jgi:hypothetical protein
MTSVLALVMPGFFDKLIGHAKTEEAYKYYSSTGAQPLRDGPPPLPVRRPPVRGVQRHRDARDHDAGRDDHAPSLAQSRRPRRAD